MPDKWYAKYEFCRSVECDELRRTQNSPLPFYCAAERCTKTAKELHHWLISNGFSLVKIDIG